MIMISQEQRNVLEIVDKMINEEKTVHRHDVRKTKLYSGNGHYRRDKRFDVGKNYREGEHKPEKSYFFCFLRAHPFPSQQTLS